MKVRCKADSGELCMAVSRAGMEALHGLSRRLTGLGLEDLLRELSRHVYVALEGTVFPY